MSRSGQEGVLNLSRRRISGVEVQFTVELAKRVGRAGFHLSEKVIKGWVSSVVIELKCKGHWEFINELYLSGGIGQLAIKKPDDFRITSFGCVKELGELSWDCFSATCRYISKNIYKKMNIK